MGSPGAGAGAPGPQRCWRVWTARLGPQTEPVIENGCETPGWPWWPWDEDGTEQQRPLQSKEPGSPVGVSSLRSSWSSQDATEAKTSLFPPRPVAQIQMQGSSWRHSNGGTKRTCFKEPRGFGRGLVLMTRDIEGEKPSPEGGVGHYSCRCSPRWAQGDQPWGWR